MPMKIKILGFIASILLRVLRITYRYKLEFENTEEESKFKEYINSKKPNLDKAFLLAFFHQDELALIPYFKNTGFSVLVSLSKDGEIMTQASSRLGYFPVRGSSSRGAVSGLIAAIKKVKQGYNFAFAVDGPRGPIFKVKEGICAVSRKTGKPILPVRVHISNEYIFEKSWNKAKFPKPFTQITLKFGAFKLYNSSELEHTLLKLN
jgi:lysophospholipid acyltransferase (LPLAT)-like uncharacterized protein